MYHIVVRRKQTNKEINKNNQKNIHWTEQEGTKDYFIRTGRARKEETMKKLLESIEMFLEEYSDSFAK